MSIEVAESHAGSSEGINSSRSMAFSERKTKRVDRAFTLHPKDVIQREEFIPSLLRPTSIEKRLIVILVIDNYDSFTYNLVQYLGEMGAEVEVRRNDTLTVADITRMAPEKIVISPGPGTPDDAGITLDLIREFGSSTPIFGVCLGLQAIGQAMGGRVIRAEKLMHGKTSPVSHNGEGVFRGLPSPLEATRYHSLIVELATLPDCLEITATTEDGEIMGLRHKTWPMEGVQFHPESVLTEHGKDIVRNFLVR